MPFQIRIPRPGLLSLGLWPATSKYRCNDLRDVLDCWISKPLFNHNEESEERKFPYRQILVWEPINDDDDGKDPSNNAVQNAVEQIFAAIVAMGGSLSNYGNCRFWELGFRDWTSVKCWTQYWMLPKSGSNGERQ